MAGRGELERAVVDVLWDAGEPMTARAVVEALPGRELAVTTVLTVLSRLETKGLVRRDDGDDGFVYRPAPRTETVAAGALQRMIDTFFAGSAASAATALLGLGQRLTADEAAALERAIDEAKGRDQ